MWSFSLAENDPLSPMEVTELKKEMSALRELLIRPAQAPAPAVDAEGAEIAQLLKQAGFSDEQLANRLK